MHQKRQLLYALIGLCLLIPYAYGMEKSVDSVCNASVQALPLLCDGHVCQQHAPVLSLVRGKTAHVALIDTVAVHGIDLNGGTLELKANLLLADGAKIKGPGRIIGNGFALELAGNVHIVDCVQLQPTDPAKVNNLIIRGHGYALNLDGQLDAGSNPDEGSVFLELVHVMVRPLSDTPFADGLFYKKHRESFFANKYSNFINGTKTILSLRSGTALCIKDNFVCHAHVWAGHGTAVRPANLVGGDGVRKPVFLKRTKPFCVVAGATCRFEEICFNYGNDFYNEDLRPFIFGDTGSRITVSQAQFKFGMPVLIASGQVRILDYLDVYIGKNASVLDSGSMDQAYSYFEYAPGAICQIRCKK